MNGFEFFDSIYYINLAARTDRDVATRYELARLGIQAQRVDAEFEENRFLAFNKSQFKALSQSVGDRVLILEDDVIFRGMSAMKDSHFPQALKELPDDWDMLFLGANTIGSDVLPFRPPIPYSEHISQLQDVWTTHAVAYSRNCIDFILQNWKYDEWPPIYDEYLRTCVLPVKKCFVVNPMIADQRAGMSDIWQKQVEYGFFNPGNEKMKI